MMNRAFLFGTSSIYDPRSMEFARVAAAYKPPESLPACVDYGDVPLEELCRIESVFRMLSDYKLGIVAQTRIFGQSTSMIDSPEDLREVVHTLAIDRRNAKIWERIKLLEQMQQMLVKNLGGDVNEHMFLLASEPRNENFRFRDTLETGELQEIQRIVVYLAFKASKIA